jgi:hypothetical protein
MVKKGTTSLGRATGQCLVIFPVVAIIAVFAITSPSVVYDIYPGTVNGDSESAINDPFLNSTLGIQTLGDATTMK